MRHILRWTDFPRYRIPYFHLQKHVDVENGAANLELSGTDFERCNKWKDASTAGNAGAGSVCGSDFECWESFRLIDKDGSRDHRLYWDSYYGGMQMLWKRCVETAL